MTKRRWTDEDQNEQDKDGRWLKGWVSDGVGCGAEGCLTVLVPVLVLAATWYFY